jgi:hypothetical protein
MLLDRERRLMLKEENVAMHYAQHQTLVTRRWCSYYSTEGRTSMLKEDDMAMVKRTAHLIERFSSSLTNPNPRFQTPP